MFPYTEQYTESETYIQNKNRLSKIHQTRNKTFEHSDYKIKNETETNNSKNNTFISLYI